MRAITTDEPATSHAIFLGDLILKIIRHSRPRRVVVFFFLAELDGAMTPSAAIEVGAVGRETGWKPILHCAFEYSIFAPSITPIMWPC